MVIYGYIREYNRDLMLYYKDNDHYKLLHISKGHFFDKVYYKISTMEIYVEEKELELILREFWRFSEFVEEFEIKNISEIMRLFYSRLELFCSSAFDWESHKLDKIDKQKLIEVVNILLDKSDTNFIGQFKIFEV